MNIKITFRKTRQLMDKIFFGETFRGQSSLGDGVRRLKVSWSSFLETASGSCCRFRLLVVCEASLRTRLAELVENLLDLHFSSLWWNDARTSLFLSTCKRNITIPCVELRIVNIYWKTNPASFETTNNPNTQVKPSSGDRMTQALRLFLKAFNVDGLGSCKFLISRSTAKSITKLIVVMSNTGPINDQLMCLENDSQQKFLFV